MDITPIARRLKESAEFDSILKANEVIFQDLRNHYPRHMEWVKHVTDDLKKDTYNRLAFGVYAHTKDSAKEILVWTAVVSKKQFVKYFEIKNIVPHNQEGCQNLSISNINKCLLVLIKCIQNFAVAKSISKLTTEMGTSPADNRIVLKALIECDFEPEGNRFRRYGEEDEHIILSYHVPVISSIDPYDTDQQSRWIVKEKLHAAVECDDFNVRVDVEGLDASLILYSTNKTEELRGNKFNVSLAVIVLRHNLLSSVDLDEINTNREIKLLILNEEIDVAKFFIFDFTGSCSDSAFILLWENDSEKVKEYTENYVLFKREELYYYLYQNLELNADDFPLYDDVCGIVVHCEERRFKLDQVKESLKAGKNILYFSLGSTGKYLQPNYLLFFSEFSPEADRFKIWGYAIISDVSAQAKGIELDEANAKEAYYDIIDEYDDSIDPIWNEQEFTKHNHYNQSGGFTAITFDNVTVFENKDVNTGDLFDGYNGYYSYFLRGMACYISKSQADSFFIKNQDKKMRKIETKIGEVYQAVDGMSLMLNDFPEEDALLDIVFIHGINSSASEAWLNAETKYYWPFELANQLKSVNVWTVDYKSSRSKRKSDSPSIREISKEIKSKFDITGIGKKRKTIFVCHSMGGIIFKSIMQICDNSNKGEYEKCFLHNIKGVLFYATPHTGSKWANLATDGLFNPIYKPTITTSGLKEYDDFLMTLKDFYVARSLELNIKTAGFYEKVATSIGLIVDQSSADHGIPTMENYPLREDHFGIARPQRKESEQYARLLKFIRDMFPQL